MKIFSGSRNPARILGGIAALALNVSAYAGPNGIADCGELANAYGPFDYRSEKDRAKLPIVEQFHFTPKIEALAKKETRSLGADLDYTLRAFPNHHRALAAMSRLAIKAKTNKPSGAQFRVECYFERASRFQPNDGIVHMVYGDYLAKTGNTGEAIAELQKAVELVPNDATANYNLGMLYMKTKEYAQAATYAKKAYALGFPLPGLKNKLTEVGAWNDTATQ